MKKFFVLGVLILSLAIVFGSMACKNKSEQKSVEFSSKFQAKVLSEIKEIQDEEAAYQAEIAKEKQEKEDLLNAVAEKVRFLEQCRNSEHLKTLLSLGCPDIKIVEAPALTADYFYVIVLSRSGIEISFYYNYGWPNTPFSDWSRRDSEKLISTDRGSLEFVIFHWFDEEGSRQFFEKFTKLSNDDIKNIIEKEVLAWNGDK